MSGVAGTADLDWVVAARPSWKLLAPRTQGPGGDRADQPDGVRGWNVP